MAWTWLCVLWFSALGLSTAEVTLKAEWIEKSGWAVTCQWHILQNDTLQSVRLYRNEAQYAIYRLEKSGSQFSETIPSNDFLMNINCVLAQPRGLQGSCVTRIELYRPAVEDTYKCEVSGERPKFILESREYTVFVPPSDAQISDTKSVNLEDSRKILNCTSTGLPAPRLVWKVGDQKVPADFSNTYWNVNTKLWHSWSSLNPQESVAVECTAEVTTKSGIVERGRSMKFTASKGVTTESTGMIVAILLTASLVR